ncbi:hypothetical protein LOC67_04090 [Stieleria sp. JC731]|uniref:hypothetical protein n=2 Tax=Pirellulaceae TaxID=2691357 RepID=UPI001E2C40A9|nr:hypothetical protein [Stieleria sp. JC731]MCC9599731.1 hypothetical protein [Stieleria sp. JC731]
MSSQTSSIPAARSSVNLIRSSHSWTEAESAAGFVLRYLTPMRRLLIKSLGSEQEADLALKILLTHLVSAGFGEHRKGRLRDYLAKAVRSCAKARLSEVGGLTEDEMKERCALLVPDSKIWLMLWRDCLLDRAWRALERLQHQDRSRPLYTILWNSTVNSKITPDELASLAEAKTGVLPDQKQLQQLKLDAKASFAQLLADEVVETLERADKVSVKNEINKLGIGSAFHGLTVEAKEPV